MEIVEPPDLIESETASAPRWEDDPPAPPDRVKTRTRCLSLGEQRKEAVLSLEGEITVEPPSLRIAVIQIGRV